MDKIPFLKHLILFIATGFGLGLVPFASGTFGALPGVAIIWIMAHYYKLSLIWLVVMALFLSVISIPICDVAEKHFGKKDDKRIVADEMLTFPICMLGIQPEPVMLAIAFVISRAFDVIKPPPARALQDLKGGLGIAIDDIIANLYALLLNHIIFWILKTKGLL